MVTIDELRGRDLVQVLEASNAERDQKDKHNWRTENGGRISIGKDGFRWYDHGHMKGGGGAIDLVMHLKDCSFKDAMDWLMSAPASVIIVHKKTEVVSQDVRTTVPEAYEAYWQKVRKYLTETRGLPSALVDDLHSKSMVYADKKENAVFLNKNKTGCELRGTMPGSTFHGYRGIKDAFVLKGDYMNHGLAFCESAIEAMSYRALGFQGTIVSYGGQPMNKMLEVVKENRAKLPNLKIVAAFNNDKAGRAFADSLSDVRGLIIDTPVNGKDWNDQLRSQENEQDVGMSI